MCRFTLPPRADRRDRMLLISAIAIALLKILGAACKAIGIDRYLKANTVKKRTISLLNQGLLRYGALPKVGSRTGPRAVPANEASSSPCGPRSSVLGESTKKKR